jgi:chromatin structure-remodeling complex subunit RSC9
MLLSLRSGIDADIGWALNRLCRLCDNEQFVLKTIPGLIDALFEWPEWYANEGYKEHAEVTSLFSPNRSRERRKRHALESLFILRNAALNEPNARELGNHRRTKPLVQALIHNLVFDMDENAEFLLHACELLQAIAYTVILPPVLLPTHPNNLLLPLHNIADQCSNRSLIIASFDAMTALFSNPQNAIHLTETSPALRAAIRYLPLFVDKPLLESCLNYLYVHLSQPAMAKATLLQPEMPSTLKLLVSLLLSEQVEEVVSLDVGGTIHTAPALTTDTSRDHELTKEEMDDLLEKPEPQRCYDWYLPNSYLQ